MKEALLTKKFWWRVVTLFCIFLPAYYLVNLIGLDKEEFWTFNHLSSSIGTAFFMALLFAFPFSATTQNSHSKEITEPTKPTWKEFFGVYFVMLLFSLLLISVLLVVGWLVIELFGESNPSFWNSFAKAIIVTAVMCLFINSLFFLQSHWQYKRWKKKINAG